MQQTAGTCITPSTISNLTHTIGQRSIFFFSFHMHTLSLCVFCPLCIVYPLCTLFPPCVLSPVCSFPCVCSVPHARSIPYVCSIIRAMEHLLCGGFATAVGACSHLGERSEPFKEGQSSFAKNTLSKVAKKMPKCNVTPPFFVPKIPLNYGLTPDPIAKNPC